MQTVTLIPGDGIGPEISAAVMNIFEAAKVSTWSTDTTFQKENNLFLELRHKRIWVMSEIKYLS